MDELNIRMLARDEALLAAEPSGAASSESASSIAEGASKVQAVHTGLRSRDTFRWVHSGSGAVAIKNVFVEFDGVVTGYADGAVTVTGTKYVYAEVIFTMSGSKATGITSVTISAADAFGDAAKKVLGEDGEVKGVRLPIYKLQKLSSADVVVCHEDCVHGVPSASVPDQWLTDADSDANLTRCSLSRDPYSVDGVADPSKPDVLGLYDFENPTDGQLIKNADSADWPSSSPDTFRKKQLLLVRSVEGETGGLVNLRYCLHNPMPSGGGAGEAAKWDATKGGWVSVPLKAASNDEEGAALGFGDRVVTGIKVAADGDDFLMQLETRALPDKPDDPAIPDISIPAATDGGSGGDTITYVSGMAVDGTDKHQINVTTKSKAIPTIPDVSVASPTDGGAASGTFDVITGLAADATDKHKLVPTKKSVTLPSSIPTGYEEETLNIITDAGIVTRKVLVETASKASVEAFGSSDSRLLLAVNTSGVIRKSKGYLKA